MLTCFGQNLCAGHCAKGVLWSVSFPASIGFCYETPSSPLPSHSSLRTWSFPWVTKAIRRHGLLRKVSLHAKICFPTSLVLGNPTHQSCPPSPLQCYSNRATASKPNKNYVLSLLYFHMHKPCLLKKKFLRGAKPSANLSPRIQL